MLDWSKLHTVSSIIYLLINIPNMYEGQILHTNLEEVLNIGFKKHSR